MRLVLDKENRKRLFELLKEYYSVLTLKELAVKLDVSFHTLKTWRIGKFLIPSNHIPSDILNLIKIDETKEENWGKLKIVEMAQKDHFLLRRTKMMKRKTKLELLTPYEFQNKKVVLSSSGVSFSRYDKNKSIKIPTEMTPELAEEIGMHIGDGTLPVNGYNFSLRGDILEEGYYRDHVQPLYEKVYGLKTRLLKRPPICGVEFDSKAIYEFKSKVLGLHIGEKKGMI